MTSIDGVWNSKYTYIAFPSVSTITKTGKNNTITVVVYVIDKNMKNVSYDKGSYGIVSKWLSLNNKVSKCSSKTVIMKGKNIGKKNETSAIDQAVLIGQQTYNKLNRKRTDIHEERIHPMLVSHGDIDNDYEGWFIQPKLDGSLATIYRRKDTKMPEMYSRRIVVNTSLKHIIDESAILFDKYPNLYFDGEVYAHDTPLQVIAGLIRRITPIEEHKILSFNIFDCHDPSKPKLTMAERIEILSSLASTIKKCKYIKLIPTEVIRNQEQVLQYYHYYLNQKYEGVILRNPDGIYEPSINGYHSKFVQKIKPRETEEFPIVDFTDGRTGIGIGAIIWICKTNTNKTFNVVPNGTINERKKLFNLAKKDDNFKKLFFNKLLTVEYFTKSIDGVPTQPKGIIIRETN
jgi:ATP-dependent DNA ligase